MELDDLRFNDKDVTKILKLAVKKEREKYSQIDTNYDSAATYQDLMNVAEERGISVNSVASIVQNEEYKKPNPVLSFIKHNANSFATAGLAGMLVSFGSHYVFDGAGIHRAPIVFGLAATVGTDLVHLIGKTKEKDIKSILKGNVGDFLGFASAAYVVNAYLY